jgi:ribonuclease HI
LTRKATAQAVKLLTLPIENPVRRAIVHAQGVRRYTSPLDTTLSAVTGRLKHITRRPLSGNSLWIHATWVSLGHRVFIADKDQAIHDANAIANAGIASLYSDASVTARCAAVAVARRRGDSAELVVRESIGWSTTCSILTAEIAAIAAALEYVQEAFEPEPQEHPLLATKLRITIFSDSQLALEAIKAGNNAKRGRDLLRRIAESFVVL